VEFRIGIGMVDSERCRLHVDIGVGIGWLIQKVADKWILVLDGC